MQAGSKLLPFSSAMEKQGGLFQPLRTAISCYLIDILFDKKKEGDLRGRPLKHIQ